MKLKEPIIFLNRPVNLLILIIFGSMVLSCSQNKYFPPEVVILDVEYLTHSSAIIVYEVLDDGNNGVITEIKWKLSAGQDQLEKFYDRGSQGEGIFFVPIFDLEPDTKYTLRIHATNRFVESHSTPIEITTPTVDYLYDDRDGQTYNTISLGNQQWMAENLNYFLSEGSVYYENDSIRYQNRGRLYTWQAACLACPNGWRLPTNEDWELLEKNLNIDPVPLSEEYVNLGTNQAEALKLPGDLYWLIEKDTVTNRTGFTAIPSGMYTAFLNPVFSGIKDFAYFWTYSEHGEDLALIRGIEATNNFIKRMPAFKTDYVSVRCVK